MHRGNLYFITLESSLIPLSPRGNRVHFYPRSNMDLDLVDLRAVTLVLGHLSKSARESHQQLRCLYPPSIEKSPA